MRKEWLLALASALVTLGLALGLLRWLAPGLLGVPTDLQLVQVGREVPPFYDNVLRPQDLGARDFLIPDPWLTRARPLFPDIGFAGPNDLLGFRNLAIPPAADILTIGDSQTYGNNVALEENWPSQLARALGSPAPVVYNASTGAWSGPEYLYMAERLAALSPRVLVVAFYSGNDPLGAFAQAYGNPLWAHLRPDPTLAAADAPQVAFPAPPGEHWSAAFADGSSTVFTPKLRHSNSMRHPAVDAGWEILGAAAGRIAQTYRARGVHLVFTLIPTKELVLAPRVRRDGLQPPRDYTDLVADETRRIEGFAARLRALDQVAYLDLVGPLQAAALAGATLYLDNANGHPVAAGYGVIARAVAAGLDPARWRPAPGVYSVGPNPAELGQLRLVTPQGWWAFASPKVALDNGWGKPDANGEVSGQAQYSDGRAFATWPYLGTIDRVDSAHFGPDGTAARGGDAPDGAGGGD